MRYWATLLFGMVCSCSKAPGPVSPTTELKTTPVDVIDVPLSGPFSEKKAELSALAWWGEKLILCPQYPAKFGLAGSGAVATISKEALLALSAQGSPKAPIEPVALPFDDGGLSAKVEGFEGFEAIVVDGSRVALTIEAKRSSGMIGYLVAGSISEAGIVLDPSSLAVLQPQATLPNMAFESLTPVRKNLLAAVFEANGSSCTHDPNARMFRWEKNGFSAAPSWKLDAIDYRITDITPPDDLGRMYALNIYWTGEQFLARAGADDAEKNQGVEQIIELVADGNRIHRTGRAPWSLKPDATPKARNWEGIARLDGVGFLIVTDEHPSTRLAIVPVSP
ncbi:MAG: hypothetical protein U0165_20550 [Polyangiaceae bacterium]